MRNLTALTAITLGFGLVAITPAQLAFSGHGQYAQFRNVSGLPGGTFGVNPDGTPGIGGAMSLSIPIAYSLKGGSYAAVLANTSYDTQFRTFTKVKRSDFGFKSNGTGAAMAGISTDIGRFTVGTTVVSGAFENSYSVLYTPTQPKGKVTYAVGAEGLFSAGGFIGPGFHSDADRVISAFGVATVELDNHIYVSGGWGTSRFSKGFIGASAGLGSRARLTVEHDGFGWNYGAGAELATIKMGGSRKLKLNGFVGMVQSKYAFWSVGLSF